MQEQILNMDSLLSMDLVVKINGGVQETNLVPYEETCLSAIENINTTLQTDDDFATAEQDIKKCKLLETRLAQAKQDALSEIDDIFALFTVIDKLSTSSSKKRLFLTKGVKTEKTLRISKITKAACASLTEALNKSPISHAGIEFRKDIEDAVKGKKLLEKMEEAVDEIKGYYFDKIAETEELFNDNISLILSSENEFPGLYHDKRNIALKPTAEVEAIVESRVNDFKFKKMQKKEAERKAEEENKLKAPEVKQEVKQPALAPEVPTQQPRSFGGFGKPQESKKIRKIYLEINATDTEAATFTRSLNENYLVVKLNADFKWEGGF